ncbi:MAG: CehA/McbA family metallohydrolase [Verrucomicrobiota bacterium]|nr:CehA/McbA family metallohydrolase [Verrucomicrobiota bacterium]
MKRYSFRKIGGCIILALGLLSLLQTSTTIAATAPIVSDVAWQPLKAQVKRILEATDYLGVPFQGKDKAALRSAMAASDPESGARQVQEILDQRCLYLVQINPEMRVKVARGPADAELVQHGWTQFLVKVNNQAGVTASLKAESLNAGRLHNAPAAAIPDLWMEMQMYDAQPMTKTLSGLELEYRLIQLYSRDEGKREARMAFNVGQGSQDLGFRNEVDILFHCRAAPEIELGVKDESGNPTTGMFEIRDALGRVYPSQAKRLAPDFSFHPQIYRADGEILRLPEGTYTFTFARGPESIPVTRNITINSSTRRLDFSVTRWIDPSLFGYWSGDHHIHAAGCAHYTDPTEGVHAPDMLRHIIGEDLKVGANLTWGPCFDYQKQFFTGKNDKVSVYPYLLRYDVEVSGFGSHQSGHLCLLRLKEQMYPGGDSKHHWPTLCLNTLRWGKAQGALVGPAHSGWGLEVASAALPNYEIPPFNGIGANEYIVDVTHEVPGPSGKLVPAVDFISTVDTPYAWELNIWYHTLNVGYRTRISGETDFPCIYGERVGLGRSYVKLAGRLDYEAWCEGIRQGKNYVSDGYSHLMDFRVENRAMGERGSELKLEQGKDVTVKVRVAARLDEVAIPGLRDRPYQQKPYWHIERARVGDSRMVPVELVLNGYPVSVQKIVADGQIRELEFRVPIQYSSWVAVRILPSAHTNPIFVTVEDQPIRASRRSAEWCLQGVDQCWKNKERFIAKGEMEDALNAYEHARKTYRTLIKECRDDRSEVATLEFD